MLASRKGFSRQFKEKCGTGKCYIGWLIPAAITAAGLIGSGLSKGKKRETAGEQTITQEPLLTEDQIKMRSMLAKLAETGKFGDTTLGEGYGGSLGNYDMSGVESAGMSKLLAMLGQDPAAMLSGANSTLGMGKQQLAELMSGKGYDPNAKGSLYTGFKRQSLRENTESADRLKAQAAYGGRLMGSSTGKELGLLNERTAGSLQDKLAELSDLYAQRKIAGIDTSMNMANTEGNMANLGQNMGLAQVQASQQYGGLKRMLEDAKAKDALAEWTRARGEKLKQIDVTQNLATTPVQWGTKSLTIPAQYEWQDSPWTKVFNQMASIGGNMLGQKAMQK